MATDANGNGNQENKGTEAPEKTFTQAELDAIVGERLSRERAKYADYETMKDKAAKFDEAEEKSKSELQKAQDRAKSLQDQLDKLNKEANVRSIRDKVAKETGVPADLLTAETEEDCNAQAKRLMDWKTPGSYPDVRDGGETKLPAGKKTTRELFAEAMKEIR